MSKKTVVGGALILTVAGLITRVLGFVYRIYMSNLIGAVGMGLFQLIFPVYMIAYTITASGIFLAISKLVAEENAKRQYGNVRKIFKLSLLMSVGTGCLISVVTFFGADWIGSQLLNEPRTVLALRFMAFSIPFMSASSCIKGYFYGLKEMMVPASSQVIEQVSRMLVIYFIAGYFIPKGLTYACAMGVIGMGLGEVISFIFVFFCYQLSKNKSGKIHKSNTTMTLLKATMAILAIALPLTGNRVITNLLQSVETILIPGKLQAFGLSNSEAMGIYGQLTGMAMPLIHFPSILTGSLSMTLIPTMSEASAVKNAKRIAYTASKSLQFTSIIGIGTACLFLVFSHQLGMAIYNQKEVGSLLYALAWICPFIYFQGTLSGILNGLGQQMVTFRHNILGSIIRILFIYFCIPLFGLKAFLWGFLSSLFIMAALNLRKTLQLATLPFDSINWVLKPLLAALAAGFISMYISAHYIFPAFSLRLSTVLSVGLLGVLYFIFILLVGCITTEDINMIKKSI